VVVDFLDVVLDIAGAHPLGIHGKDELLEAADILLAFLDDGRVELGFRSRGTSMTMGPTFEANSFWL